MIECETDKNDISICSYIFVDCENNFTRDKKEVIDKFDINNYKTKMSTITCLITSVSFLKI